MFGAAEVCDGWGSTLQRRRDEAGDISGVTSVDIRYVYDQFADVMKGDI